MSWARTFFSGVCVVGKAAWARRRAAYVQKGVNLLAADGTFYRADIIANFHVLVV